MQFLRKTGLVLAATAFFLFLFGFGMFLGIERVFGTSETIKNTFRESGIYSSIVSDALEKAQKEEGKANTSQEIPINRPEVRKIINDAFPPQFMQNQTEGLLDGVYAWLHGKTPMLEFSLDLSDSKARLADGVARFARERLASLPACTANDLPAVSQDVDPFNAPCVPPGYDPSAAAEKARQKILSSEFMKDTKLTAADLKTSDGKTFNEQYKKAPKAYQNVISAVYAMAVVAALMGVAVVFLSVQRRSGIRKVAILGLVAGGFLVSISWLLGVALDRVTQEIAKQQNNEPMQQKLMNIVQSLGGEVRSWWLWFGLVVIMLGVGALVALHYTKPKDDAVDAPQPNDPTSETLPAEHTVPSKQTTHHHKTRR